MKITQEGLFEFIENFGKGSLLEESGAAEKTVAVDLTTDKRVEVEAEFRRLEAEGKVTIERGTNYSKILYVHGKQGTEWALFNGTIFTGEARFSVIY